MNFIGRQQLISIYIVFALVTLGFVGIMVFEGVVDKGGVEATTTLYVGGSGAGNYSKIQYAINNASSGDTIRVFDGIYYENIIINKTVNLIGNGTNKTILNGSGNGDVVYITEDWVNISGFRIENSGKIWGNSGIELYYADNCNISNCHLLFNCWGIYPLHTKNCSLYNNKCTNNTRGLYLSYSNNLTLSNNICINNTDGIRLFHSNKNKIINNNTCKLNHFGIYLFESRFNRISHNIANSNSYGILLSFTSSNNIIENNICNYNNISGIETSGGSSSTIIANNSCLFNNGSGIYSRDNNNKNINNTCFNNKYGILVYGNNNIVLNNTLNHNNKYGLGFFSSVTSDQVHYNHIYDNGLYGIITAGSSPYVNATYNWWGHQTGPNHPSKNPKGQGDNITNEIKFIPWLKMAIGNHVPTITNSDIKSIKEDIHYNNDYNATDPDEDDITWFIHTNASWLSINSKSGLLKGDPTNVNVGIFWVNVTCDDDFGGVDSHNFSLSVLNVPPTILTADNTAAAEDISYEWDYNCDDDGQGNVLWFLNTNASWLNLNSSSGEINGIPTNDDVGWCWVNISVSDGNGGIDYSNFTLEITNTNDVPKIDTTDVIITYENQFYQVTYTATEIDLGDELTWSFETDATWLQWGNQNHTLFGTPTNNDVGTYWVRIRVFDSEGEFDENYFSLEVINVNDPPIIDTIDQLIAIEDEEYEILYKAKDVDIEDTLIWKYNSNANWLFWNSKNHMLYGTPTNNDVGSYWVRINVTDGNGGYDEHYFELNVTNINDAPTIIGAPNSIDVIAYIQLSLDLSPYIDDIDNHISELKLYTSSEYITVNGLVIILNYTNTLQIENVNIIVSDGIESSNIHTIVVSIIPNDIFPPTIIDKYPIGTNISVTTDIYITFNEPMDQTSVENAFSIEPEVKGKFKWNKNTITFSPDENLFFETTFSIQIETTAKDLKGNLLQELFSWEFTTIKLKDSDGDNYADNIDDFPENPNEWIDSDKDGVGDNLDAFPNDKNEWEDNDNDKIGNNADTDDDNDMIPDNDELKLGTNPFLNDTDGDNYNDDIDFFPLDPTKWEKESSKKQDKDSDLTWVGVVIGIIIIIIVLILFLVMKRKKKSMIDQEPQSATEKEKQIQQKPAPPPQQPQNLDPPPYQPPTSPER